MAACKVDMRTCGSLGKLQSAMLCSHLQTPKNLWTFRAQKCPGPGMRSSTREQLVRPSSSLINHVQPKQRVLPEVKARASSWIWQRHLVQLLNSSLQSRRPLRNRIGIGTECSMVGIAWNSRIPSTWRLPRPCPVTNTCSPAKSHCRSCWKALLTFFLQPISALLECLFKFNSLFCTALMEKHGVTNV